MKWWPVSLLVSLMIVVTVCAQHSPPVSAGSRPAPAAGNIQSEALSPPAGQIRFSHYRNFYRENFVGNVLVAPAYSGFQGMLCRAETDRLMFGVAFQWNRIFSTNQKERDLYRDFQPSGQYMFVPILLNVKLHLIDRADVGSFVPYLTAGFGPALGLFFPYGNNFFKTLGAVSGEIGGGGYLGIGTDFLWQEEWALSFDVRYNFFRFSHPLGENQEYKGVSFFVGFSRALDY